MRKPSTSRTATPLSNGAARTYTPGAMALYAKGAVRLIIALACLILICGPVKSDIQAMPLFDIIDKQPGGGSDYYVLESSPDSFFNTSVELNIEKSTIGASAIAIMNFDMGLPDYFALNSASLHLWNIDINENDIHYELHGLNPTSMDYGEPTWNYRNWQLSYRWPGDTNMDGGPDGGCSVPDSCYATDVLGSFTYLANTPANTEHIITIDTTEMSRLYSTGVMTRFVIIATTEDQHLSWYSSRGNNAEYWPKVVMDYTEIIPTPGPTETPTETPTPGPAETPTPGPAPMYQITLPSGSLMQVDRSVSYGDIAIVSAIIFLTVIYAICNILRLTNVSSNQ